MRILILFITVLPIHFTKMASVRKPAERSKVPTENEFSNVRCAIGYFLSIIYFEKVGKTVLWVKLSLGCLGLGF